MDTSNQHSILWLTQWHILTYGFFPCHIFFFVSLHIFLWVPSYAIEEDKAEAMVKATSHKKMSTYLLTQIMAKQQQQKWK